MSEQFFDINKFPPKEGLLVFPISMSRIGNLGQDAKTYWKYIEHFNPEKIIKTKENSKVGAIFVYGDFLYLHSDEKASILKKKFMNQISFHRNSFMKIIRGHTNIILDAFSFKTWNQFYLEHDRFVSEMLPKIKQIYEKDKVFQKYIEEDFYNLKNKNFKFNENQIEFFLEEHLLVYLISKGQMRLQNNFINGNEKWILTAYPGKPPKAMIYLSQLNPFKLENIGNKYQNCWYDLEEKKLYDFNKIDLETYYH